MKGAGARCRDPLCCAVSSSAIAVTILILIWTGPMLYRSILNHVSVVTLSVPQEIR